MMNEPFSGSWLGVCQWVVPTIEWQMSQETPAMAIGLSPLSPGPLISPVTTPAGLWHPSHWRAMSWPAFSTARLSSPW